MGYGSTTTLLAGPLELLRCQQAHAQIGGDPLHSTPPHSTPLHSAPRCTGPVSFCCRLSVSKVLNGFWSVVSLWQDPGPWAKALLRPCLAQLRPYQRPVPETTKKVLVMIIALVVASR